MSTNTELTISEQRASLWWTGSIGTSNFGLIVI
jgi:hypothetical protein